VWERRSRLCWMNLTDEALRRLSNRTGVEGAGPPAVCSPLNLLRCGGSTEDGFVQ